MKGVCLVLLFNRLRGMLFFFFFRMANLFLETGPSPNFINFAFYK